MAQKTAQAQYLAHQQQQLLAAQQVSFVFPLSRLLSLPLSHAAKSSFFLLFSQQQAAQQQRPTSAASSIAPPPPSAPSPFLAGASSNTMAGGAYPSAAGSGAFAGFTPSTPINVGTPSVGIGEWGQPLPGLATPQLGNSAAADDDWAQFINTD